MMGAPWNMIATSWKIILTSWNMIIKKNKKNAHILFNVALKDAD